MRYNISKDINKIKVFLYLLLFSLVATTVYMNRIDVFSPKHISIVKWILTWGKSFPDYSTSSTPLFYIFGAQLMVTTNINIYRLMFYPFFSLFYMLIIYLILLAISRNKTVSLLITLFIVFTNTVGYTLKLWPHALGQLIFLTILYLLLKSKGANHKYFVLLITLIVSLSGISYSYAYMVTIISIVFSLHELFTKRNYIFWTVVSIISIIAEFSLIYNIYDVILSSVIVSIEDFRFWGFSKIIHYYLVSPSKQSFCSACNEIQYSSNRILTMVLLIKYITIATFLIVLILMNIKENMNPLSTQDKRLKVLGALWISTISWMIIKLNMGQLAIPAVVFPTILTIMYLSSTIKGHMKFLSLFALILLIISISQQVVISIDKTVNNFPHQDISYYHPEAKFISIKFRGEQVISDEFTRNLLVIYYDPHKFSRPSNMIYSIRIYSCDDICNAPYKSSKVIIINCDKNIKYSSLLRWNLIKSPCVLQGYLTIWKNKLYTTPFISAFK